MTRSLVTLLAAFSLSLAGCDLFGGDDDDDTTVSEDVCTDTCGFAADGDCDDGGPGSAFAECDYGTDCTDCGPRPSQVDDDDDAGDPCDAPPNGGFIPRLCQWNDGVWPPLATSVPTFGVFSEEEPFVKGTYWFDDEAGVRHRFSGGAFTERGYPEPQDWGRVRVVVMGACTNPAAFFTTLVTDPDDTSRVLLFSSTGYVEFGFEGFSATGGALVGDGGPQACEPALYDWCPGTTFGCAPYDFELTTPFADPVTLRQGGSFVSEEGYQVGLPAAGISHDGNDWMFDTLNFYWYAIDTRLTK